MNTIGINRTAVDRKYRIIVIILSLMIPAIVLTLIFSPQNTVSGKHWVYMLPHLNALLNSATILLLVLGFIMIKRSNKKVHQILMTTSFVLGSIFLVSYLIYHGSAESVIFGDANGNGLLEETERSAVASVRLAYLVILLTHILLAILVAPLVLLSMIFALKGSFASHRKVVHYAYPVWLYVSVSGVVVYLMIRPYYL